VLALVVVPAAAGHGTLSPATAEAGSTQDFELTVPGDRLDADIVGVALRVADGAEIVSAEAEQPLWSVSWDDDGVTWEGGPIDRGGAGTFRFTARMPSEPGFAEFSLVETYDDGVAAPFPLPVAVAGGDVAGGSSSDGMALAALLVAIVALIASTAALALSLRGRSSPPRT
jgi:uncharacterized protein YcnI